jgi:hypothetical protein
VIEEPTFWQSFWESDAILLLAVGMMLGVFDRLIELVIEIWDWLLPFVVIKQYERGVILRWGVWNRDLEPGFRWYYPGVEAPEVTTVVRRTAYLDVQSLTSKDGINFNISPIVIYWIRNIKRWQLEVDDAEEAINDITYGLNDELATETLWKDVHKPAYAAELTRRVKKEGTTWGGGVEVVKFSDRSKSRSMRLWTGSGGVSEEEEE